MLLEVARSRLKRRKRKGLARLVLCYDTDADVVDTAAGIGRVHQRVQDLAREFGGTAVDNEWLIEKTILSAVCWHTPDPLSRVLPACHTLDRITCAAVMAAYPPRGEWVQHWLDGRPDGPLPGPKHYGWSYYAGWYAHHGAEDYYRHIWTDKLVAIELDRRLDQVSGWTAIKEMAR